MTQRVTESLCNMLLPLQWPNLKLNEYLWEILHQHIRQHSPLPSSKHQMGEYLLELWCFSLPAVFQRQGTLNTLCPNPVRFQLSYICPTLLLLHLGAIVHGSLLHKPILAFLCLKMWHKNLTYKHFVHYHNSNNKICLILKF